MNAKKHYATALTIAGSDSSGGAGIQADLKTFSALGVFGMSAITAVTAQNTLGVRAIQSIDAQMLKAQIEAVFDDIKIDAVKIGMLHSPEIVEVVAGCIDKYSPKYVILDPVMVASSGDSLIENETVNKIKQLLYSRSSLLTPNLSEAEILSGIKIKTGEEMIRAGEIILNEGCNGVLIKGGHLNGNQKTDILLMKGKEAIPVEDKYIECKNTHGTGCTLSSAIAAYLSLGLTIENAVKEAKIYVTKAIEAGADINIGHGHGPLNHFFDPKQLKIFSD